MLIPVILLDVKQLISSYRNISYVIRKFYYQKSIDIHSLHLNLNYEISYLLLDKSLTKLIICSKIGPTGDVY